MVEIVHASAPGNKILAIRDERLASETAVLSDRLMKIKRDSDTSFHMLEKASGLSSGSLSAIFLGRRIPSRGTLVNLLRCLETSPDQYAAAIQSWERVTELLQRHEKRHGSSGDDGSSSFSGDQRDGLYRLRDDAVGYELKPDPLSATTKEEFLAVMREFHVWAGEPSYRDISLRVRKTVGASTLCEALDPKKPPRLPTLKVVTAFVHGCGGSEEDQIAWATAWRRIRMTRTSGNITQLRTVGQRHVS